MLGWDENEPVILHLAPTAHVTFAQFNEKNGPVMIAVPVNLKNLFLPRIDSDKRSRPDDRVQGVVIQSDVSVERTRPFHLLKHERTRLGRGIVKCYRLQGNRR